MFDASKIDWKEVEAFFYEGHLRAGWVSGNKVRMDLLTGSKVARYYRRDLGLVFIDQWTQSPGSNKSAGSTMILYCGVGDDVLVPPIPIWIMQYRGWYEPEAIPLVKERLRAAYSHPGEFAGCRGLDASGFELLYQNDMFPRSHFRGFAGRERVVVGHARELGFHEYNGLALV